MSSHEGRGWDLMDNYLRMRLKNWASRTHPPGDGRARLLWAAAVQPPPQREWSLDQFLRWLTPDTRNERNTPGSHSLTPTAMLYAIQLNFLSVL